VTFTGLSAHPEASAAIETIQTRKRESGCMSLPFAAIAHPRAFPAASVHGRESRRRAGVVFL